MEVAVPLSFFFFFFFLNCYLSLQLGVAISPSPKEEQEEWEKEEKQNLMHVAVCRLFMEDGYYKFVGKDQDGWPHYELLKAIPHIHLKDQEGLLKEKIVGYFKEMKYI